MRSDRGAKAEHEGQQGNTGKNCVAKENTCRKREKKTLTGGGGGLKGGGRLGEEQRQEVRDGGCLPVPPHPPTHPETDADPG